MPDHYDIWEQHDRERERDLRKHPKCSICKDPIQEEQFFHVNGIFVCEDCMENCRENTEDFMEE